MFFFNWLKENSFPFDSRMLIDDLEGQLYYQTGEETLPLYTESGKLLQKRSNFQNGYILVIRYLGWKAGLFIDELLMEKEIVSDNLRLQDESEPYIYKAILSGSEYLYLSPSIIRSWFIKI